MVAALVGVDEVGRGSCVGRLYVAAVVIGDAELDPALVKDSKKLSPRQLERAYDHIVERVAAAVPMHAEVEEVDAKNVSGATVAAWHRALDRIDPALYDKIIVDGIYFRPYKDRAHECVPKADRDYLCVAAASIVAKVTRDRYIAELCAAHPELERYGIPKNKGYPTPQHKAAIAAHGPTPWHRKSFKIKPPAAAK